jgi:hypothetical protein
MIVNWDEVAVDWDEATAIEIVAELVCLGFPESTTVAVKLNVPLAIGMPEIAPVDDTRETPAGNCPDIIDHV